MDREKLTWTVSGQNAFAVQSDVAFFTETSSVTSWSRHRKLTNGSRLSDSTRLESTCLITSGAASVPFHVSFRASILQKISSRCCNGWLRDSIIGFFRHNDWRFGDNFISFNFQVRLDVIVTSQDDPFRKIFDQFTWQISQSFKLQNRQHCRNRQHSWNRKFTKNSTKQKEKQKFHRWTFSPSSTRKN